ncbi:hypothetical protein P4493_09205 [Bacillus thuringiensis]|uniref:Group-specific protein n=8 Tax=Bacillus cereus group TaxID=86661 RepID=A0A9W7Q5P4_BACCE|nr:MULTISPECIES: hypothetical protein [Bacillus]EAO54205.1 hypothetical protein RBTH_04194 [Bacillus thuringiensis serovar israelensis ATCC 35646]EEM43544.1 hypothetical protein bthur0004_4500 [Bacillus thuringiensis serovar sotto str. T04001]MED1157007.1 hypothetical protein [Bacillus paranthracis]ACK97533.1 hypothetical protein BCG9842_B4829 [Bacillus cereus G9842]AFQ17173.1 hypothetical protein BTG_18715 [Bacillus thuringiensis HD-771]
MSNDKKLKLLQYLYFFPAMLCMMLFINSDVSSSPYAKLLGTISGSFAAIMLAAFWNLKLHIKNEKSS